MKKLFRQVSVALVALSLASSAWAGECCKQAAQDTKDGKACAKCLDKSCCKKASAKVVKAGEAKACEKCGKKS